MLTETFQSIAVAARTVVRNWPATLLIAIVYAALLAVLYFFVIVREATFVQVSLTFASAIIAPLLFFVLQAMVAGEGEVMTATALLKRSLASFWKLILITLPLIALGILIIYLLGKAQNHFDANARAAAAALPRRLAETANARNAATPIDWKAALLSTIRYLAFGLVLPLVAIHLWLATVREGLAPGIIKLRHHLARAFAPQSVLIYIAGFLIFGVAPYYLLFRTTQTSHAWLELSFLVARLVVVFALTLFGWVITVRALARFSTNPQPDQAREAT
ncbi:MAG TPA: hypothetical protein VGN90_04980 [Pyrinomonadaceae bacterium]|jgi:hypothetical protein|nr:hypothetical protein [Pyrinomonadaceae bacterium]